MIDFESFHELRRIRQDSLVQAFETNLHRTGFHARAVEHVLETNAGPARVSHGAVRPLPSRDPGLEIAARVSRALIDGRKLEPRERKKIVERQRHLAVHMAAHRQPEGVDTDVGRDSGPMPPHEETVVGREGRLVEHLEWRFEQRRPGALKDERTLLGKCRRDLPFVRSSRQGQLSDRFGKRGARGQRKTCSPGPRKKMPARRTMVRGDDAAHGSPSVLRFGPLFKCAIHGTRLSAYCCDCVAIALFAAEPRRHWVTHRSWTPGPEDRAVTRSMLRP